MAFRDVNRLRVRVTARATTRAVGATPYQAPGLVSDLDSASLLESWNNTIAREYAALENPYGSRFFSIDPGTIAQPTDTDVVKWAADPAEPNFCFNRQVALTLSDWNVTSRGHVLHKAFSVHGRRQTHNEYCEYRVVYREGADGKPRAKRVIFTTELREYWQMLAEHSPARLQHAASDALKREVSFADLYGPAAPDPEGLSPDDRRRLFATWVAGAAQDVELQGMGVPTYPIGPLNNLEALFMYHPINGLDDLLYIVMFGAHPYARVVDGERVRASKDEIFSTTFFDEPSPPLQLACRHADPGAATGAAGLAFEGRTLAFANPLGMYFRSFSTNRLFIGTENVPPEWVRFSRGARDGLFQRLEFGPSDSDAQFLSDITIGEDGEPVTGGYQLTENIEVGPLMRFGAPTAVTEEEFARFQVAAVAPVVCGQSPVCRQMARLRDEHQDEA